MFAGLADSLFNLASGAAGPAPSSSAMPARLAYEKERIELLRELKRVMTLLLEQQHEHSSELTEEDPVVGELLVWAERCLWHGLKRTLPAAQDDGKRDVTLFTVISEAKLLPPQMSRGQTEEDIHDAELLEETRKEVLNITDLKSSAGRSRAWVRLALNKGILGTYGWLSDNDAGVFYDLPSIWRSTEQKAIAVSLLSSLKGLKFNLSINCAKMDSLPEPSRRPHFLGISSMKNNSNRKATTEPKTTPLIIESRESKARQERVLKERQAIEELRGKTGLRDVGHLQGQEQANPTSNLASWFMGALNWTSNDPTPSISDGAPRRKPKPVPPFLGSSLVELVTDPRTCSDALLDWRIGVPKALTFLLLMIEMEETNDMFDPRHVAEEDNPHFVIEVGSLIRRLSDRDQDTGTTATSSMWDGGSPTLVAVSALKLFFRQLPEPIIPYDMYDALLACQKIGDVNARVRNIKFLIDNIPDGHKATLLSLIDVVGRRCDSHVTNSISAAHSLAPALLRPRPGPEGGLGRASEAAELIAIIIEQRNEVFADIARDIHDRKLRRNAKLHQIEELYQNVKRNVEWPGTTDEEWMKRAWVALAPNDEIASLGLEGFGPISDGWIQRGFRSGYMTHDFRGCGFSALQHLVFLGENYTSFTRKMVTKHSTRIPSATDVTENDGMTIEERIAKEEKKAKFPFALGAAQMSRGIIEMLGIDPRDADFEPRRISELSTWPLLDDNNSVGHIFALAMMILEHEWTVQQCKAMDFNRVRREVILYLSDIIDSRRPRSFAHLRTMVLKERPSLETLLLSSHKLMEESSPSQSSTPEVASSSTNEPLANNGEIPYIETKEETSESKFNLSRSKHYDLLPRLHCPFPNLESTTLKMEHVEFLEPVLPSEYRGYDWEMVFSTTANGFNLDAFYTAAAKHSATILVISDAETDSVFGAFCSEPWANHGNDFYGTGQSFLFTFSNGKFQDFQWTKANELFMNSNEDFLVMGQGENEGFGLYLDSDLRQGTTTASSTYGNTTPLVSTGEGGEFTCKVIELWSFIPKTVSKQRTSSVASM